ncbi:MAG: hypothetical protein H7281_04035 [Bacteriovorax sp.]|nr:hypothetical protein [Bacteriovorax sp.]
MKRMALFGLVLALSSCSELKNNLTENKVKPPTISKNKKVSSSKKIVEAKKVTTNPDITGLLVSGVEYEATPETDGFVISFDPFIAKDDDIFTSATTQIIAKLYSDTVKDESHISILTDIDYAIFKGTKARYRIVPFKETNGEISSISITSIH